ncbi:GIN domain-containing protein [Zunongwangia endophytica]|uniref:GIN domain-containing protein n=1 Tax=Zunongwangia endophytica TaxID=1808945 RepID=A0ABV8HCN2_9FLAO|nr:DUF2807 domain-containing protein [Zunongwangia endophytica]MDN3593774.1 DUF2807 domain-containing protein [Zunongwangia endophytica]
MKKSLSLFLLFVSIAAQAQVVGNRNVINKKRNLDNFTEVNITGDFEVTIVRGNSALAEVEADENLHDLIRTDVVDGKLYIKPAKRIKRSKRQEIKLEFPETITKIKLEEDAELDASKGLVLSDLEVETSGKSKLYLTVELSNFKLNNSEDATVELNVKAKEAYFQLNGSSKIKALVNSSSFKIDSYERADAAVEGTVEDFQLRTEHTSTFEGENLTATNAKVIAEGRSKNEISVTENLTITAKDRSETTIFNSPKIEIETFAGEAVLKKAEF